MEEAFIISDKVDIYVYLFNGPTRAVEEGFKDAHRQALKEFGFDDSGNSNKFKGYHRSDIQLKIVFKTVEASWGMTGVSYTAIFEAYCVANVDEDGDEDEE